MGDILLGSAILGGAGLASSALGSFMGASAADKRAAQLRQIANFAPINIDAEMASAVSGNNAILPVAEQLASSVNTFNRDELMKQLRAAIPGYDAIVSGQSNLVQSQLKGEIPKDVQDAISRRASERNLFQGTSGSQFGRNLEARDLGLTSMDITNRGFANAMSFLQSTKAMTAAPTFDVSSMFMTPQQRLAIKQNEQAMRINAAVGAASAPTGADVWSSMLTGVGGTALGMGTMAAFMGANQPAAPTFGGGPTSIMTSTPPTMTQQFGSLGGAANAQFPYSSGIYKGF